jgi:sugar phosphate isomerase/epimerase
MDQMGSRAGTCCAGIGDEAGPTLAEQIAALEQLGWSAIELRTVDGVAIADLDDRAFGQLADHVAAAGLDVVCIDSRIANWSRPITGPFEADRAELAALAPRCARLGTRYIRVMSYPNDGLDPAEWGSRALRRLRELAAQARDHGLVLLHENCSGWAGASADRMLDLLAAAGPALGLLFDTGNGIPYGYDAHALLTKIVGHVAHVHVKDATGGPNGTVYTMPGEGDARVPDCLRTLLQHGYAGAWSIEPHLSLRPHEGAAGADRRGDTFVSYGRHLERLLREKVFATEAIS